MCYYKVSFPSLKPTAEFIGNDNKHFACIQAYTTCAYLVLLWCCRLWNWGIWKIVLQCISVVFSSCFLHFLILSVSSVPPLLSVIKSNCDQLSRSTDILAGIMLSFFPPSTVSKYAYFFCFWHNLWHGLKMDLKKSGETEALVQLFHLKVKL